MTADEQKRPQLTLALRKTLERAGAWDSLPDDDRTRAAKKMWLAKQAEKKRTSKKKATTKKTATKKTPSLKLCTPDNDPKLQVHDGSLSSDHATLPDLTHLAKNGYRSLWTARGLKRAPELHSFLDACSTLRELHVHNPNVLMPPPTKSAVRHLSIDGSSTSSLAFLRGFPELEVLKLAFRGSRQLKGFGDLVYVPNLRRLHANQHGATSLVPLGKLERLVEYAAASTKDLRSLDGLQGCPGLRHVDANLAPICELTPLSGAKQMLALKIRSAHIDTLEPIYDAKEMQTLFAEKSRLRSLDGIARGLPGLRLLWIHSTRVTELSPLRGMKSLLELDVSGLSIEDFSVLGELKSLEHLDLYETSFADLDLLASLPNLVSARVEKTKVKRNDSRVKKLNQTLKKKHGPYAGLGFSGRPGALKLGPTRAAFAGHDVDSQEYSETLL